MKCAKRSKRLLAAALIVSITVLAASSASADTGPTSDLRDGYIIYLCRTTNDLCRVRPDGSRPERLTRNRRPSWFATSYKSPSLSLDGRRLAFVRAGRAYAANARARNPRLLTKDEFIRDVSLRNDGKRVLLLRTTERCEPWPGGYCKLGGTSILVGWDGRGRVAVPTFVTGGDWLDARRIVVTSREDRHRLSIREGPRMCCERVLLEHERVWLRDPAVSPDRRHIAVTVEAIVPDRRFIAVVSATTGEFMPVTEGPDDREPTWSPRGDYLAFSRAGTLVVKRPFDTSPPVSLGVRGRDPTWGGF